MEFKVIIDMKEYTDVKLYIMIAYFIQIDRV